MRNSYAFFLFVLVSCAKDEKPSHTSVTENAQAVVMPGSAKAEVVADSTAKPAMESVTIKDASLYSNTFVEDMKAFEYPAPIQVIGNYVLVEGNTLYFPEDLTLHKTYVYTGQSKLLTQTLTVKRINLSAVDYKLQIHKGAQLIAADSGQAHLRASFFLAPEADEDDKTGIGYAATEYVDDRKNCSVEIRIGMPQEDEVVLKAIASSSCNPAWQKAEVPPGMTLRTKKE